MHTVENRWPRSRISQLKEMWAEEFSISEIAEELGVTRSSVYKKAERLGLSGRSGLPKKRASIRVSVTFTILYDEKELVNKGVDRYIFSTKQEARNFWLSSGQSLASFKAEIVKPFSKADMISRINDMYSELLYSNKGRERVK